MKPKNVWLIMLTLWLTPLLVRAWSWQDLHDFTGTDGKNPTFPSSLVKGADGNYYGVASNGGTSAKGTIYQLQITGTVVSPTVAFTKLHDFAGGTGDGDGPVGSLVQDNAGNFYGTTNGGGAHNDGTVYKLSVSGGVWTVTVLYSFGSGSNDGQFPNAGLTIDNSGSTPVLYGTTAGGGLHTYGTVFKLTQSSGVWSETKMVDFNDLSTERDGGNSPAAELVLATDGNLYGTTSDGGANDAGTIFQLVPSTNAFTVLHNFAAGERGLGNGLAQVFTSGSSLLQFVGTTTFGGSGSHGTVYTITQASSGSSTFNFSTLYSFTAASDGAYPYGTPVYSTDNGGSVYATTSAGGTSKGILFNITYSGTISYSGALVDLPYGPRNGPIWAVIGGEACLMGTSAGDGGINSNGLIWEAYLD